jgi:branched-chain amino acid transport system substrate-binding protein
VRLPRRATASAVVLTLLGATLTGCTSDDEPAATRTRVVIGADLASGSAVDTAYSRGLQLRIAQINASGVLGDRELVLRIEDNGSDPTSSLRNISTLAEDPSVVAVVTGSCGECAVGAVKTINDKGIPTIALTATDRVANPVADRRFLFKLGPNSADSAAALIAELQRPGVVKTRKVALLHTDDYYGTDAKARLDAKLRDVGITVTSVASIKPTATDITQAVGTLADSEPDALVFLVGPEQAALAATAAGTAKFTGRLYFDAAAAGDLFIPQEASAATENATMVFTQTLAIDDVVATTPAKAARKQWFRDYTSRYGSYSGVAAFGADAVTLIADGVAQAGTDRVRVRDILETSQIDGLSGPIRITPDNHSGLMPQALTLLVARSGRWRLAG